MKKKIVIRMQQRSGSSPKRFFCSCIKGKPDEEEAFQTKVLKKIAETYGVISVAWEGDGKDKAVVIGEGIDATKLTSILRKYVGEAHIESMEVVKEKEEEPEIKFEYLTSPIVYSPAYFGSPLVAVYP